MQKQIFTSKKPSMIPSYMKNIDFPPKLLAKFNATKLGSSIVLDGQKDEISYVIKQLKSKNVLLS